MSYFHRMGTPPAKKPKKKAALLDSVQKAFNPDQPRDDAGRWEGAGTPTHAAVKDKPPVASQQPAPVVTPSVYTPRQRQNLKEVTAYIDEFVAQKRREAFSK